MAGQRTYAGKNAVDDLKKDADYNTLSQAGKESAEDKLKKGDIVSLGEAEEIDYEGAMVKSQILSIVVSARDIFSMIDDTTQFEGWVQSKLTLAEDYLDSVKKYLEGQSL